MAKQYATVDIYEKKLKRVMERFGVKDYNYDWNRTSSWIEFKYKGDVYRFDHSIENAKAHGINLRYGSDVFAQLVLSLEDLARMVERGIYDLQRWVAGMRLLPAAVNLPECFKVLGFDTIPKDVSAIDAKYKSLAKQYHPDMGGTTEEFTRIKQAAEEAKEYLKERNT